MFVKATRDPKDSGKMIAVSLLDGYQAHYVRSSKHAQKAAIYEVSQHNLGIVDYLKSTGQLAEAEDDPAVIATAWKNREVIAPKVKSKLYITQNADVANWREVRSLIDGHLIRYHMADVGRALAEMNAYNAELVNQLIKMGWLAVEQSHDLAAVVRAYKNSTEQN